MQRLDEAFCIDDVSHLEHSISTLRQCELEPVNEELGLSLSYGMFSIIIDPNRSCEFLAYSAFRDGRLRQEQLSREP